MDAAGSSLGFFRFLGVAQKFLQDMIVCLFKFVKLLLYYVLIWPFKMAYQHCLKPLWNLLCAPGSCTYEIKYWICDSPSGPCGVCSDYDDYDGSYGAGSGV